VRESLHPEGRSAPAFPPGAFAALEGVMSVAKVLGDPVLFDRTSNVGTVQSRDSDVGRIMKPARL
jgi:hypothetical protein